MRWKKGCLAVFVGFLIAGIGLIAADYVFGIAMAGKIRRPYYRLDAARDLAFVPGASVSNPVETFDSNWAERPSGLTYKININSLGFRGPETTIKPPPGVARIVCMGDSSAFGWGVEEGAAWPRALERSLNASGAGRFEALNLGVFSYTSHNGLVYFRDFALSLDPKIAVISFGTNDPRSSGNRAWPFAKGSDNDIMPLDRPPTFARKAKVWSLDAFVMPLLDSNIASYLRFRMAKRQRSSAIPGKDAVGKIDPALAALLPKPRVTVDDYRNNLRAIKALADSKGIKIVFLAVALSPPYLEVMKSVAAETGSPILVDEDIYATRGPAALSDPAYSSERQWSASIFGNIREDASSMSWFRLDAVHPTPLGHRLIAEELARTIAGLP